jgi:hypothetical protein
LQTEPKAASKTVFETDYQEFSWPTIANTYSFLGESMMLTSDMQSVVSDGASMPPQLIIEIAKDNTVRPQLLYGTMGVCVVSPTLERLDGRKDSPFSHGFDIHPRESAGQIFPDARFDGELQADIEASEVKIIQQPRHGTIKKIDEFRYKYIPQSGYIGDDRAVLLVNIRGNKVRVIYFIKVLDISIQSRSDYDKYEQIYRKHCEKGEWRISYDLPRSGLLTSHLIRYAPNSAQSPALLSFDDLSSAVIGQTTGQTKNAAITLSPTAAGYGWFIDLTPSDNAEFLPTSNPFEWIARPGSEAEGRMDLLTVLFHEYGHAAGLDHSADSHDLMASTLLPSVRRLPSATELIALRGLLTGTDSAPVPYDPDTPPGAPLPLSRNVGSLRLSRLRPSEPGDPSDDTRKAALTQFSIVANPTLLDRAFVDGTGWSTSGEVVFEPGSATLKETPLRKPASTRPSSSAPTIEPCPSPWPTSRSTMWTQPPTMPSKWR